VPRPNFSGGDKHHCLRNYGIGETKPVLFVTGGSQGADSLNRLVFRIAGALTRRYYVIHQCGVGKVDKGVSGHDYVQVEFVDDEIRHIYAATDLVVSRAGATAIAEISMYRVPALYIPYPWAEGDHQRYNASIAATRGGCEVLSQEGLTPERLLLQINEMMARRLTYRASYATCDQAEALPRLLDIIERYAAS